MCRSEREEKWKDRLVEIEKLFLRQQLAKTQKSDEEVCIHRNKREERRERSGRGTGGVGEEQERSERRGARGEELMILTGEGRIDRFNGRF